METVRVDKWLWAARFFKTRSLAKHAIASGKIRCNGQRIKAGKSISANTLLTIRQGWNDIEIHVIQLSEQRRSAPDAMKLYQETAESIKKREKKAMQYQSLTSGAGLHTEGKPTKKQRRQIQRFKNGIHD